MSYQEHHSKAKDKVNCAIVTVSDTRTMETDRSGQLIRELLEAGGHSVCHYTIVRDSPAEIDGQFDLLGMRSDCQAVLLTGGTGIAPRDGTIDVVARRLSKKLDGFGELFRVLSYEEIGSGAMMSRAIGGIWEGRAVFAMPGSTNAVGLAMNLLILPELAHMVWELSR